MEEKDIKILLDKYRAGTASEAEIALLESWYLHFTEHSPEALSEEERLHTFNEVWANLSPAPVRRLWPRIAAAASIILAVSAGGYFLLNKSKPQQQVAQVKTELLPGTNAATLTLSNGQQIGLTKNMSGQVAMQGNTKVSMQNGGAITYSGNSTEVAYNTLTTKRKQQFPLVLADGTEVMLDAESSITYPVAFNGTERKVKVTGQAYFKVVHNDKQPFAVEVKGQTIRDIGTEFNINAYDDEPVVKTTLVEGLITVNDRPMKPGQAAETKDGQLTITAGDLEEATALKNNLFHFSGTDLKPLMRQLARWYDVDVTYQGEIPQFEFGGDMSRGVKATEILEMLEKHGLKVSINGKNITLSKK